MALVPSYCQSKLHRIVLAMGVAVIGPLLITETALSQEWRRTGRISTFSEIVDVYFVDEDIGYAVDNDGAVHRTRDAGVSWSVVSAHSADVGHRFRLKSATNSD